MVAPQLNKSDGFLTPRGRSPACRAIPRGPSATGLVGWARLSGRYAWGQLCFPFALVTLCDSSSLRLWLPPLPSPW